MIEIRKLGEAERPAMVSHMRDLAHRRGHEAALAGIERIAARLADPLPEQEFLVAIDGAAPLGLACFTMPLHAAAGRPQLLLQEICVAANDGDERQDTGDIGHALLRAVVRLAIARGCAGIDVDTATAGIERGTGAKDPAAAL
jgi:hypothetical protein